MSVWLSVSVSVALSSLRLTVLKGEHLPAKLLVRRTKKTLHVAPAGTKH